MPASTHLNERRKKPAPRTAVVERRKQRDRRQRDGGARGGYELRFSRGRRSTDRLHIPL